MAFRSDSYYTYAEALCEGMPEKEDEKEKLVKKVDSMNFTRVLSGGEDVKLQELPNGVMILSEPHTHERMMVWRSENLSSWKRSSS
mmetsp:Transcript_48264/g.105323  ORF Transcript_48264/g.105323 Transcript_48264/m.105323 type:complete len:86 (+) Transcript_48264:54-311(+)